MLKKWVLRTKMKVLADPQEFNVHACELGARNTYLDFVNNGRCVFGRTLVVTNRWRNFVSGQRYCEHVIGNSSRCLQEGKA